MLTSRKAPVPNVALASPGRTQPCPINEACWSPAMPQMGGAPGRALASATAPDDVTSFRHARCGHPEPLQSRAGPKPWSAVPASTASVGSKPVMAALLRSVTWARPPLNCQTTQVSRVPKRRSRPAVGVVGVE